MPESSSSTRLPAKWASLAHRPALFSYDSKARREIASFNVFQSFETSFNPGGPLPGTGIAVLNRSCGFFLALWELLLYPFLAGFSGTFLKLEVVGWPEEFVPDNLGLTQWLQFSSFFGHIRHEFMPRNVTSD